MAEDKTILIIVGLIGIGGTAIGSILNFIFERRNRKEDFIRINARERLEILYIPLLNYIESPQIPDEPFELDREQIMHIKDTIIKKRLYASHNLMKQAYKIEYLYNLISVGCAFSEKEKKSFKSLDWDTYRIIAREETQLREIAGLGKMGPSVDFESFKKKIDIFYSDKIKYKVKKFIRKKFKSKNIDI